MIGWFLLCAVISFIMGSKYGESKHKFVRNMVAIGTAEILQRAYNKFKEMGLNDEEICETLNPGKGKEIMFHVEQIRKERKEKSA